VCREARARVSWGAEVGGCDGSRWSVVGGEGVKSRMDSDELAPRGVLDLS